MISELQKRTCQAIVNIFETGKVQGEHGQVTVLKGDSGHLTYGRSQTTLASGNLYLLLKAYCDEPEAEFAPVVREYLDRFLHRDLSLDRDQRLRQTLRAAGDDPVMRKVQDEFFDRVYWAPSASIAQRLGVATALGTAVIYDSNIHGSWGRMRDRTNQKHGQVSAAGEQAWIGHYVQERKDWLGSHSNPLLRRTVYRMEAFQKLIQSGNWDLALPIKVRGLAIEEAMLEPELPRVSAQEVDERMLMLRQPYLQGEDVRGLQSALKGKGFALEPDGVFGPTTDEALKKYQTQNHLCCDGIVGPATRAALGLS